MSDKKVQDEGAVDTAPEFRIYRWALMGNSPVTGDLRHTGDHESMPVEFGTAMVESGHCVMAPEGSVVGLVNRGERSYIVGYNISEEDFRRGADIDEMRGGARGTSLAAKV